MYLFQYLIYFNQNWKPSISKLFSTTKARKIKTKLNQNKTDFVSPIKFNLNSII